MSQTLRSLKKERGTIMEKIALVTDTACDIDQETLEKYNIHTLPFRIIYEKREFIDKIDITPEEIYNNMKYEIPKSSLPSMEDIDNLYKILIEQKYTHVIAILISSGLSGTVNAVRLVNERYPDLNSYIYDTKSTSLCEGILIKQCGKLIEEGRSFEEITNAIPVLKSKLHFYFVFGTLEYAIKGGRIGKIPGTIGNLLDIKPIVGFDEEYGQCYTHSKVRGRNKSLNKLTNLSSEFIPDKKLEAYIVHGNSIDDANKVALTLKENPFIEKIHLIGQISAVVGVYSGPGTLGVCYMEI
jgi:DegV family protein with EDD domain